MILSLGEMRRRSPKRNVNSMMDFDLQTNRGICPLRSEGQFLVSLHKRIRQKTRARWTSILFCLQKSTLQHNYNLKSKSIRYSFDIRVDYRVTLSRWPDSAPKCTHENAPRFQEPNADARAVPTWSSSSGWCKFRRRSLWMTPMSWWWSGRVTSCRTW